MLYFTPNKFIPWLAKSCENCLGLDFPVVLLVTCSGLGAGGGGGIVGVLGRVPAPALPEGALVARRPGRGGVLRPLDLAQRDAALVLGERRARARRRAHRGAVCPPGLQPERGDCGSNQAAGAICDSATDEDFMEEETRLENCFANGVSFSPTDEIGDPTIFSTSVQCQRHCSSNPNCVQFSFSSIVKMCHLYSASSKLPNPFEVGGPPNCSTGALPAKLSEGVCLNGTCQELNLGR